MTPKQIDRIQNKIKQIRKVLYEEKKKFGGYHDGRGLRYVLLELYLKIQDYKGGLTYLRWFNKTFPEDIGMPVFMFGSAFIYHKNHKNIEAEKVVIHAYLSDPFLFDIFLNRPIESTKVDIDSIAEFNDYFNILKKQNDLSDFSEWLIAFEKSDTFQTIKSKYQLINERLETEEDEEKRNNMLE